MFDIFAYRHWFNKYFSKRDFLFVFVLIVAYLITRLINLDQFPIFTDEGIYIHWAKIAWKDAAWRFISLTDGKQPLHTWGMIPFLKLFPDNLLLGGRLFSVLTGFVSLTGLFLFLSYVFSKRTGYIGAIFYIFTPMFMFYDRMALADSAVNAGFIWILFGTVLLIQTLRLDVALLLGMVSGFALLAKSSTQMFMGLGIFAPILLKVKKQKRFVKNTANYFVLYLVAMAIAFVIYNVQRLTPYLHYVAEKNNTFVMTFQEFSKNPSAVLFSNIPIIPVYVASEMAYVLAFIGLAGFYFMYKRHKRMAMYLAIWIILPFIAIAALAKVIFPRYIMFFATLLTIPAAVLMSEVKDKRVPIVLGAVYVASIAYFNYTIWFDNKNIPFPPVDRGQYVESFNAGWGIKDMITFSREKAKDRPVILVAEGNFGVIADMLESSLAMSDTNISVRGYWPLDLAQLKENQAALVDHNVFVVFSHREEFPADWPIRLIKKYPKPGGKYNYYLYELLPSMTIGRAPFFLTSR